MENMKKLGSLVDEINKLISTSNAEAKRLRDEVYIARKKKYDAICEDLREFGAVVLKVGEDVCVPTKISPNGCAENYKFELHESKYSSDKIGVFLGKIFAGYLPIYKDSYETMKDTICFDIDAIIDEWDRDAFEKAFIKSVSEVMKKKAEKANENLEAAKDLHKKNINA